MKLKFINKYEIKEIPLKLEDLKTFDFKEKIKKLLKEGYEPANLIALNFVKKL